jgi:EmrB/QacA subfamily drug resistance transporter
MVETAVTSPGAEPVPAAPHSQPVDLDPRRWVALLSLLTAIFMVLLDVSIVNVAIPAIRNNLSATNADIQFVIAGYALSYALLLITGGRLGDIYGRKRVFMVGMLGFVVASALCGLAQSALMLDLSRVVQGLFAALMFPQVLSMIQVLFPPQERGKAFGFLGSVIGIATITGPLAGGLIIRDDLTGSSWRWIFLVNLPIGIAALFTAWRVVRESKAPHANRLDIAGVGIATLGLFLLVYPLVEGRDAGWPAWSFISIAASFVVLAYFVVYERGLAADRFPLVQLSLFRTPAFRYGVVISGFFIAGIPAFFLTFSLTVQVGLGYSALRAGLVTIPFSVGTAIASAMSARLAPRLGKYTISVGCTILCAGMAGVIATLQIRGESLGGPELIPALFVCGLGLGTVIAPLLHVILAGVPQRDAGSASGVLTTFQQLGGAIGIAVVGVIFFGLLGARADTSSATVITQLRSDLIAANVPQTQIDSAVAQFTRCFHDRASESDPAVIPPSCPSSSAGGGTSPVAAAFTRAATLARARDFVSSMELTIIYNIALWVVTGLLALLLPNVHLQPQGAPRPGAAPAPATP